MTRPVGGYETKPTIRVLEGLHQDRLDVKRFYMPVVVEATCPDCGRRVERNLTDDYLGYPVPNVPFYLTMSHPDREDVAHDFSVRVVLALRLEVAQ